MIFRSAHYPRVQKILDELKNGEKCNCHSVQFGAGAIFLGISYQSTIVKIEFLFFAL